VQKVKSVVKISPVKERLNPVQFFYEAAHITNTFSGLLKGSRFFAKNAKIVPLLKAPDEGVRC